MRNLTRDEQQALINNNCRCTQWELIKVVASFNPDWCREVTFSGACQIGDLSGARINDYGVEVPNGIRSACIHECSIGDAVCIDHVHDVISRYDIGDRVTITNVNVVAMKGQSTFGVGVKASVLNETGGMEVPISRNLTAQTAYLMTLMGLQDKPLRDKLISLVEAEAEAVRSDRGTIEEGASIRNCGSIINAYIGESAHVEGATLLENCSLCSSATHPIHIGHNVMGRDFVVSLGAHIGGSSVIERCFIGQSCHIDHLFSAHDSLLFANCHLENGEACAIFAGPFTVSSHKSSLLIAGHFSFLNAGSGSNQSNHLYKLGPIHQGVVERGSKTSSDSYVLWPSRIGAFTLIMGRHVHHVDTTDFPFSYLVENSNRSYLVPGRNLLSVGTMRDAKKWPARDKRPKELRPDCVNYNLLSPFTIGKMERAYHKLTDLKNFLGGHEHVYVYYNLFIKPSSLDKGIQIYKWGIEKFIGNSLIQRIQNSFGVEPITSAQSLIEALKPDHTYGQGKWVDASGMIAPLGQINTINEQIKSGELNCLPQINVAIRALHQKYYDYEWDWSYDLLCRWYHIDEACPMTITTVRQVIDDWIEAVLAIDNALLSDAHKEYNTIGKVNFEIEGDDPQSAAYQAQIEHEYEENSVVLSVKEHIERKQKLYETTLAQLAPLF